MRARAGCRGDAVAVGASQFTLGNLCVEGCVRCKHHFGNVFGLVPQMVPVKGDRVLGRHSKSTIYTSTARKFGLEIAQATGSKVA